MQSSYRGYLLTDQENFLDRYYDGLRTIPPLIKAQKAIVSDKYQKKAIDSIVELHNTWIRYADSLITTKRDTLPAASLTYRRLFDENLRAQVGEHLIRKIREVFVEFDSFEYDLRSKRRAKLQKSIHDTWYVSLSCTILVIVMVLIGGIYFIRLIVNRISKMVNLAEKITTGDFVSIRDGRKDELGRLVSALNQMSETLEQNFRDLKQKNQELDQFAYVVSHDLKAPLRGISNIISWMEEDHAGQMDTPIVNNLDLIKGRALRLENMINGLLEYARIEKYKVGPQDVNLNDLVEDIRDLVVPEGVELHVDELPVIHAERLHLHQVFSNLISNAFKHNKSEKPVVHIHYKDNGDFYEFTVSDNGPGIEKEYHEKIFVIFQTLQERDAFESTGVGLAIVKKIIEENKGSITVSSVLGKGTSFRFLWPKTTI